MQEKLEIGEKERRKVVRLEGRKKWRWGEREDERTVENKEKRSVIKLARKENCMMKQEG